MFRFGTWFFRYKLSFLATRFLALLLFWRGEVTPWLLGVSWVPRVRYLVDGDAPALHTSGSSYHNCFYLSNFENLSSLKTWLLHFLLHYWKFSFPFYFLSFKSVSAISDPKAPKSSSSNLRPFFCSEICGSENPWSAFSCFVNSSRVFLVSSHWSLFAFFTF